MKRKANLYEAMSDPDLIKEAIRNAAKGKTKYAHVRRVILNDEKYIRIIQDLIENKRFTPSPYIHDQVKEGPTGKIRDISKPRYFPDQVIHWCVYLVLKPWLFKRYYALNCGSIPGRGVHYGKKFVTKWVTNDKRNTKYYLKMDVRKFYPSIQPEKLISKLRKVIKDEDFIHINEQILYMDTGLPIGMLLSQVYANFFLTDFDFWIKQDLHAKYYIRYMDDMVIFGPNKKELHKMRRLVQERLASDGLTLKGNWQVSRFDKEPLDFMGFRFYRDHVTIRKSIAYSITRKVRKAYKAGSKVSPKVAGAVVSYMGWISHTNTHGMYCKWIKPYLNTKKLKDVIRRSDPKYNPEKQRQKRRGKKKGRNRYTVRNKIDTQQADNRPVFVCTH